MFMKKLHGYNKELWNPIPLKFTISHNPVIVISIILVDA
jgi:uncharacterized membrane protein